MDSWGRAQGPTLTSRLCLPPQRGLQLTQQALLGDAELARSSGLEMPTTRAPSAVRRTPQREQESPPVFATGLLFTQKCWSLDDRGKNVTASLHVLQSHGVKPLEHQMESHTSLKRGPGSTRIQPIPNPAAEQPHLAIRPSHTRLGHNSALTNSPHRLLF